MNGKLRPGGPLARPNKAPPIGRHAVRGRLGVGRLGWPGLGATLVCLALAACANGQLIEGFNAPGVYETLVNADFPTPPNRSSKAGRAGSPATFRAEPGALAESYPGSGPVANPAAPSPGLVSGEEGYTLNFDKAPLADLTKVILKDTLQIPYVFDPRVQGRVTLATGRALSRDELLAALESVLQMNRGVLIREGSQFRIAPIGEAKIGGTGDISYAEEAREVGIGYGVTIFPLKYVSAETMLGMLRTFAAKPGALRAEVRRNVILVRGSGRERRSLVRIAQQFDLDWLRGQSVGIYRLKHSGPGEMIAQLRKIFQTDAKGLGRNLVKFQPVMRLKAVLVIARRAEMLRKARMWISRLDRTDADEIRTFVYHVQNAKAKYLAGVLNDSFGGQGSTQRSASAEVTPNDAASELSGGTGSAGTSTNGVGNARLQGAQFSAESQETSTPPASSPVGTAAGAQSGIRIIADEVNNNLIIRASDGKYQEILGVLAGLDRAPVQVLINATLAEVTLNDNLRYGVQAFLERNENRFAGFSNGQSLTIAPQLPGLNLLYGLRVNPKIILDALSNETSVRVVSSPSVVVVNNQPAVLQVGDEVPVSTRQAVSVTDPAAPIVNNIEFRDTGVILKVTPQINTNDVVRMVVEQEISNVANAVAVGAAGSLTPTISKRRVASTISVQSGQMVVLAGLISERKDYFKNRVPIWEKVPILGQFPGKTDNGSRRTELVIFLMPRVIHNNKEAGFIAEELRERLRVLEPSRYRKYERWPRRKWEVDTIHSTSYEPLKY